MKLETKLIMENQKIISRLAQKFADMTYDKDDLFQEGCLAVIENGYKYDPEKGSEACFVFGIIKQRFLNIKSKRNLEVELPDAEMVANKKVEDFDLGLFMSKLSTAGQNMLNLIVENHEEIIWEGFKQTRVYLRDYAFAHGWGYNHYYKTLNEIDGVLNG